MKSISIVSAAMHPTPIGLLMRLAGRDSMGIGEKTKEKTFRVRRKARDAKHLEKPY